MGVPKNNKKKTPTMDKASKKNTNTTAKRPRGGGKSRDEWRRYGEARRRELVTKDEVQGGTRFEMHKKCQIERYFHIAEKVCVWRL